MVESVSSVDNDNPPVTSLQGSGHSQRVRDKGIWWDRRISFFTSKGAQARPSIRADSLAKGDRMMITGRLRQRTGDPEGEKRSVTELEADEVGASLEWATAKVERSSQRGNGDRHRAGSARPNAAATTTTRADLLNGG